MRARDSRRINQELGRSTHTVLFHTRKRIGVILNRANLARLHTEFESKSVVTKLPARPKPPNYISHGKITRRRPDHIGLTTGASEAYNSKR